MNLVDRYSRFFAPFAYLTSLLLLVVRWNWGSLFMKAGAGKLGAPDRIVDFFTFLGIPFPELNVVLVSWVEYGGGFLLMIGLASRLVSIPLLITMLVAMFTAHAKAISLSFPVWYNPTTWDIVPLAAEGPFAYIIAVLLVLIWGPGKFSIDAAIKGVLSRSSKS